MLIALKRISWVILLLLPIFAYSKNHTALIQRVEPLSWWVGMQNSTLQLSIYGKDVSTASFSIAHQGVQIVDKVLTDNPNYVFLYLKIDKNTQAGIFPIHITLGKQKQKLLYELKARSDNSANRSSFTAADAIYLVMPDRFANGNTTNDSPKNYVQGVNRDDKAARHGGDLDGLISKVPYLADLGVTALWTTPLFENNDSMYSYHHYACSDYYKIDARFGTNADYKRLAQTCHANGLKIIIDIVPNHCGVHHWWMKDKPAANWFNEWPTYTATNYRMSAWTDPHASKADLNKLIAGWFSTNMPDFNLNNKLVFDYLTQVYIYWIEYAGIDGIRVDTYPYSDIQLAANFIQMLRNEYPNINVVGECWANSPSEIAYFQSGNNNKDGFDSRLPSVMDFSLVKTMAEAFNEEEGWSTGMARIYEHFAKDFVYANTNNIMNFLDNHDLERYSTVVAGDVAKYKMALSILMTVRGFPQLYAGTEIMHTGAKGSYEGYRFDFPGGWATDTRNAFTDEGRTAVENDIFNHTKNLLHYRKKMPALQHGKMVQFIPHDGIYVYFRYTNNQKVMVVVNNNIVAKNLELSRFNEILQGSTSAFDIVNGELYMLQKSLAVPAKTVQVFELNK